MTREGLVLVSLLIRHARAALRAVEDWNVEKERRLNEEEAAAKEPVSLRR